MKMRVPAVTADRHFRCSNRARDLILDRPPFPALAQALLGPLHRIELARQIVPDAMPSRQRDHDRLQPLFPRPCKELVQLTPACLTDPPSTARAKPDASACLQARKAGTDRTAIIFGQMNIDPGPPRDHGPPAKPDPLLRQELRRGALELERLGPPRPCRLILGGLVNGFRSITESACGAAFGPVLTDLPGLGNAPRFAMRRPAPTTVERCEEYWILRSGIKRPRHRRPKGRCAVTLARDWPSSLYCPRHRALLPGYVWGLFVVLRLATSHDGPAR